jgi:glycosyltransferase involved in cell wall biosynthesis
LELLRAAATSDSIVATATPLFLGTAVLAQEDQLQDLGLMVPVEEELKRPRARRDLEQFARLTATHGLCLRPRIASIGRCAYVRRSALEVTGLLNEGLALDAGLADLAVRVIAAGMVNVIADNALMDRSEGSSLGVREPDDGGSAPVRTRVQATIVNDESGPLRRAINAARVAIRGLSVTIDGRALVEAVGGTQTYIIELIAALAQRGALRVRVLVAPDLSERAANALASFPGLELLTYEQALEGPRLTDVVHRPQPIFTADDLTLLRLVGKRIVIGQQDLIAYHNYSYHPDIERWRAYRRTTRLALAAVDQVIFFSNHARRDALAEDLVSESRAHVVGVGAEVLALEGRPSAPADGLSRDDLFVLCIGADYEHKNRTFAIELVAALRELGWQGRLVLAGGHVPFGSSQDREQEVMRSSPELGDVVIDLGPVDEPTKNWLYEHAQALLYPTRYEGFGLVPLEAARAGLPCLFAPQASLSELAGEAATLVPWNARASASAVLPILTEQSARSAHLMTLRELSTPGWDEVAQQLADVYKKAVRDPPPKAAPRVWQELDRENHITSLERDVEHLRKTAQEYQDAYHALEGRVALGLPLIDQGGLLSEAQQRGLMRVAAKKPFGGLLLAPLGVLGRLSRS